MIPGHTKFKVDGFFGHIKSKMRAMEIYHPQQIVNVCNSVKNWNCQLIWPITDWRSELEKVYTSIPGISSKYAFRITEEGVCWKNFVTDSDWSEPFNHRKGTIGQLNPRNLQTKELDENKKDGLRACMSFVPDQYKNYWNKFLEADIETNIETQTSSSSVIATHSRNIERPQSRRATIESLLNAENSPMVTTALPVATQSRGKKRNRNSQSNSINNVEPSNIRKKKRGRKK
jgi:hypothetical protein